jgi:hypothetical protein
MGMLGHFYEFVKTPLLLVIQWGFNFSGGKVQDMDRSGNKKGKFHRGGRNNKEASIS